MADRRLQVFYTVAKQLSFTKAADQLFMTQPAVTFQVKQLEEQFNTRLFERSHGRIALTPAGRLVMDYAERVLALSEEMEQRVADMTGNVGGPLLLGASTTIAEYILPKILGEFKAQHPEVQAHMAVANSETIVHRSHEDWFNERAPSRIGLVRLPVGVTLVAHVHAACASAPAPVRVETRIDHAGRAVIVAFPPQREREAAADSEAWVFDC